MYVGKTFYYLSLGGFVPHGLRILQQRWTRVYRVYARTV